MPISFRYEKVSWIPVLLVYISLLGSGGPTLRNAFKSLPPTEPATAGVILTFASNIAGFVISYVGMMADYTVYMKPSASRCVHSFYRETKVHGLMTYPERRYSYTATLASSSPSFPFKFLEPRSLLLSPRCRVGRKHTQEATWEI